MAQAKINGSTDWPVASNKPNFTSDENGGTPATLVIHDDKHERVFTESEVKAILEETRLAVQRFYSPGVDRVNNPQPIEVVARAHGIVLDPA